MFYSATVGLGKEAGITSQNTVGYQTLSYNSAKKPILGFTFMSVDGKQEMRLGDVKALGAEMDPDGDAIQVLDPNTTKTTAQYTYVSKEMADSWGEPGECDEYIGWWDLGAYEPGVYPRRDDVKIPCGTGFLLGNALGHNIQFQPAGTVPAVSTSFTTSNKKPLIATYIPTTMTLGDIEVDGEMDPDGDAIQVLNPNTTKTTAQYTYVSKAIADSWGEPGECDEYIGWWDLGAYEPGVYPRRDDVVIEPGATFLLGNALGHEMTFKFKSAFDITVPAK